MTDKPGEQSSYLF